MRDDRDEIKCRRVNGKVYATIETHTGDLLCLPHHVTHSPAGFSFGDFGGGSADLAYSILAACCIDEWLAREWADAFKAEVVSRPHLCKYCTRTTDEIWSIKVGVVRQWLKMMDVHCPNKMFRA